MESTDSQLRVFIKPITHEGKEMHLLVGVDEHSKISRVKIKGVDAVNGELLAQFEGRTFDHSFDIARTPEDLLFVPAKLKAITGNIPLSEHIAKSVKAVMQSAHKLFQKQTQQREAYSTF